MARHHIVLYNVQRLLSFGGSAIARALDATVEQGWTRTAYRTKVDRIGAVLRDTTGGSLPAVIVLIEIEDANCLDDVLSAAGWSALVPAVPQSELVSGWNIAIAFNPAVFPGGASHVRSHVFNNRFSTRDLLVAELSTGAGPPLVVMGSHWPSRKISSSGPLRQAAATYCDTLLEARLKYLKEDLVTAAGTAQLPSYDRLLQRWQTPVLIAGDLNDEPWDTSVRTLAASTPHRDSVTRLPTLPRNNSLRSVASYLQRQPRLYNPTWNMENNGATPATYRFDSEWHRIDQMLVTAGMLTGPGPRYIDGSLRAYLPQTITVAGQTVAGTTANGYPIAFDPATLAGVSDHLPLVAEIDV